LTRAAVVLCIAVFLAARGLEAQGARCWDVERPVGSGLDATGQGQGSKRIRVKPSSECLPKYLDLVKRFRGGDFEGATRELRRWSVVKIGQVIEYLKEHRDEVEVDPLDGALVLHTEVALSALDDDQRTLAGFHETFARELILLLGDAGKPWLREFLLLMGYYYQRPGVQPDDGPSMTYFKEGLRWFPEDADLLLAAGSLHEAAGRLRRDGSRLRQAESYYRLALAARPDRVEAHLRLGGTLVARRAESEALAELSWVLDHTGEPYLLYLAHLFAGDLHRASDGLAEAIDSYHRAVETRPESQVARLALGDVLERLDRRAEAREIISQCVQLPVDRPDYEDGWWRYQLGQSDQLDSILVRWHQEVLRR